jgi:hypothetical protein
MDTNVEYGENYINDILHVDNSHYDSLMVEEAIEIINNVYKNSLNENSPRTIPPKKHFSADLYTHQQAMLYAMEQKEKQLLRGPYYNEIGILGSGPSSGKTLTALAYIAQCKEKGVNDIIINKSIKNHNNQYSFHIHNVIYGSQDPTLIIVPSNSYNNWVDEIRLHTFLNPLYIEKLSQVNKLNDYDYFIEQVNSTDFILLSDKQFNKFNETLHFHEFFKFKRIFIDAPEIINIKKKQLGVYNGFIWLLTNTWYNFLPSILYYTAAYLRNAHPFIDTEWKLELEQSMHSTFFNSNVKSHKFAQSFMSYSKDNYKQIIRCRESFIKESMNISLPIYSEVICKITKAQRALIPAITEKVAQAIRANDISNAYNELGVECLTLDTLISKIKNVEMEKLINSQNVNGIIDCEEKIKHIESRISAENDCPICFERLQYTTYLPCCKQCVCGECALKLLTPTCKMKCIYCRKYNSMSDIKLIGTADDANETTLTKFERMAEYISQLRPNSKVLIFAVKDYHFVELLDALNKKNQRTIFLRNSSTKRDYNANLMDFRFSAAEKVMCIGLNSIQETLKLDSVTHVLTFYKLPYHIKELLISRANSSDRREPLQFVSFLYQDGIQDLSTLLIPGGDLY